MANERPDPVRLVMGALAIAIRAHAPERDAPLLLALEKHACALFRQDELTLGEVASALALDLPRAGLVIDDRNPTLCTCPGLSGWSDDFTVPGDAKCPQHGRPVAPASLRWPSTPALTEATDGE